MKVLITGSAGFIGMHTALRLLARGDEVIGVDNLNDYYDVTLKHARLKRLQALPGFSFHQIDIADKDALNRVFAERRPDRVINLAAQAGVRYSLTNPHAYIEANLLGFTNVLEACRHQQVEHLVYASSSSVYGGNTQLPFSESHSVDHPVSLYAATKKANELMAHTYSHLFGLPTTGLRFFTVYGPWGRPDMAMFMFTKAILDGQEINVFNHGKMVRDFTFVDDIVEGVIRVLDKVAQPDPAYRSDQPDPGVSNVPYRIFNIGNNQPQTLMAYIGAIEQALGVEARKNFMPLQAGDVPETFADTQRLEDWVGFRPGTPLQQGVDRFVAWYLEFYQRSRPAA